MATVIWEDNTSVFALNPEYFLASFGSLFTTRFDYLWSTTNISTVDKNYVRNLLLCNGLVANARLLVLSRRLFSPSKQPVLIIRVAPSYVFVSCFLGTHLTLTLLGCLQVLSHELDNVTMSESQKFLPQMQKDFALVPIAVCNNNTNPYVEAGYAYPDFAQWQAGTRTISLVSATAVASAVSFSLPLTAGQSGSLFVTGDYATGEIYLVAIGKSNASLNTVFLGAVTAGDAAQATVLSGSVPAAVSTNPTVPTSSSSSVPAATHTGGAHMFRAGALVAGLGGLVAGAAML